MNFFNEYALLVAVALPVVVIVGIQVFLFVSGERGTLLLPGLHSYPSVELAKGAERIPEPVSVVPVAAVAVETAPSNDAAERIAA